MSSKKTLRLLLLSDPVIQYHWWSKPTTPFLSTRYHLLHHSYLLLSAAPFLPSTVCCRKINSADCVDMDCDAKKKCMVKDTDGTFVGMGPGATVLPQSQVILVTVTIVLQLIALTS